ncbi:hypothetical protein D1159_05365 [Pseudoflavonifractor sp. 524-17]|uniref:hypothetical protein n=1 Tax=Pseudoflavonifractor sp. 524-17 TaxID=2304577 RepID=UPI001379E514|nr:hypothetical protein [Pseudoflavonifractor sp. 524-17]NCE64029.1 hypothetical protein [Pseudoflavonifractor sp. 524-17]
MKVYRKAAGVLCAAGLLCSMAIPASADSARVYKDYSLHPGSIIEDHEVGTYPFHMRDGYAFFRVALHNTGDQEITMSLYEVKDGMEILYNDYKIPAGKWGGTGVEENAAGKSFVIRFSCDDETYEPEGFLNVRIADIDFL